MAVLIATAHAFAELRDGVVEPGSSLVVPTPCARKRFQNENYGHNLYPDSGLSATLFRRIKYAVDDFAQAANAGE